MSSARAPRDPAPRGTPPAASSESPSTEFVQAQLDELSRWFASHAEDAAPSNLARPGSEGARPPDLEGTASPAEVTASRLPDPAARLQGTVPRPTRPHQPPPAESAAAACPADEPPAAAQAPRLAQRRDADLSATARADVGADAGADADADADSDSDSDSDSDADSDADSDSDADAEARGGAGLAAPPPDADAAPTGAAAPHVPSLEELSIEPGSRPWRAAGRRRDRPSAPRGAPRRMLGLWVLTLVLCGLGGYAAWRHADDIADAAAPLGARLLETIESAAWRALRWAIASSAAPAGTALPEPELPPAEGLQSTPQADFAAAAQPLVSTALPEATLDRFEPAQQAPTPPTSRGPSSSPVPAEAADATPPPVADATPLPLLQPAVPRPMQVAGARTRGTAMRPAPGATGRAPPPDPRCTDILLRASLGPPSALDLAYLRQECRR